MSGELGVTLTAAGASVLAAGSRGTPRTLHALLGRARDLAQVEKGSLEDAVIDSRISERALRSQGIDASGLSRLERRILEALVSRMRPMGLRSLADMIGESRETVASVYEPYLFREGYLARTQRGRVATERAREALKRDPEARPTAALSCGPLPGGIRVLRIRWQSGAKAS